MTANKRNTKLEVQVFWQHRNDYEWRLRDESDVVIAKGRASNYATAKKQGSQRPNQIIRDDARRDDSESSN
jgi:hypothetical protein